jgi:hypothetical protein
MLATTKYVKLLALPLAMSFTAAHVHATEPSPEVEQRLAEIRAERAQAHRRAEEAERRLQHYVSVGASPVRLNLEGILHRAAGNSWVLCNPPAAVQSSCISISAPVTVASQFVEGSCITLLGLVSQAEAGSRSSSMAAESATPCHER